MQTGWTLDHIDNLPLEDWFALVAFAEIEPFGFEVQNLWHGIQCQTTIAPWSKNAQAEDFMLKTNRRKQTWQEVREIFRRLSGQHNRKDKSTDQH